VRSENSFSALLARWANDTDLHAALTTPIRVDGPYGALAMRDWRDHYAHLLLCGGGSGVAPLMAMVAELLRLHAERRLPHVQSVHLIWVASSIDPIRDWFPQQLRDIRRAGAPFELHLHDTNSRGKSIDIVRSHSGPDLMYTPLRDMEGNGGGVGGGMGGMQATPVDDISRLPIMTGRPDFAEYFAQVSSWKLSGDNVGVFSCGPPSMLDSVRVASAAAGFALHEEVFEW
jgi:predicted ferric reductase